MCVRERTDGLMMYLQTVWWRKSITAGSQTHEDRRRREVRQHPETTRKNPNGPESSRSSRWISTLTHHLGSLIIFLSIFRRTVGLPAASRMRRRWMKRKKGLDSVENSHDSAYRCKNVLFQTVTEVSVTLPEASCFSNLVCC